MTPEINRNVRNADKIKSSFAFFAGQHPVRDGISVEKRCLRKNRAVRYEMCLINNCVPYGTQRKMNVICAL